MIDEIIIAVLCVLGAALLITLITSLICYLRVFYSPPRKPKGPNDFPLPPGKIYVPYYDAMIAWMKEVR